MLTIVEQPEGFFTEVTYVLVENLPQCALSTRIAAQPSPGSNPGHRPGIILRYNSTLSPAHRTLLHSYIASLTEIILRTDTFQLTYLTPCAGLCYFGYFLRSMRNIPTSEAKQRNSTSLDDLKEVYINTAAFWDIQC
jgi:hypothetical protein